MNEILLMSHVLLGVFCIVTSVWIYAETLNVSAGNIRRIRFLSQAVAGAMTLAMIVGGYWYVTYYAADKAVILKGPWPFAHSIFMETKEHLVIMLLLLTFYLPIVAKNNLIANFSARRLMLLVSALIVLLALAMEGEGAMIAMGVKVALRLRYPL